MSLCYGTFLSTLVAIHIYSHTLVLLFSLSWYSVLMLKRVQQEALPPSVGVAGQDFVGVTLRQEPCGAATLSSFPSCDIVVVFLLLPDFSYQPRNWLVWLFHGFPQALQKLLGKYCKSYSYVQPYLPHFIINIHYHTSSANEKCC